MDGLTDGQTQPHHELTPQGSTENIPQRKTKKVALKKPIIWNTNKKESWKKYFEKMENNTALENAVEEKKFNKLNNKIRKEMSKIKYTCFGKVSVNQVNKKEKELLRIQK